jgi:peroxiredoxin Q/BCP
VYDLAAFAEAQELNFTLLSDTDGSAARKYDVLTPDGRWANRVTFVLDPRGVLRHVDRQVKVDSHGADLAAVIRDLQKT